MNKNKISSIAAIIFSLLIISSCEVENKQTFPLSEGTMIENNLFGSLLEYAIYDTNKTGFVEKIFCEKLDSNKAYSFRKINHIINDSSFYHFELYENEYLSSDDVGFIYLVLDEPESFYYYNYGNKFSIDDFDSAVAEIAEYKKSSIEKILNHTRLNEKYIPDLYFIVEFHTIKCNDRFVEKVIEYHSLINSLINSYASRQLKNDKVEVIPYIEIRVVFANNSDTHTGI